jgi:hypothetical protein
VVFTVLWAAVTLPKPSHILLVRLVPMRPFLTLVAIEGVSMMMSSVDVRYLSGVSRWVGAGASAPTVARRN